MTSTGDSTDTRAHDIAIVHGRFVLCNAGCRLPSRAGYSAVAISTRPGSIPAFARRASVWDYIGMLVDSSPRPSSTAGMHSRGEKKGWDDACQVHHSVGDKGWATM